MVPYAGDPDNFTVEGIPRHLYPIRHCNYELKLQPPFEVSDDDWGNADIRVPPDFLEDPSTSKSAPDGSMAQDRVSYAFPSRYRGEGMKEWFAAGVKAKTAPEPLPLNLASAILGTQATLRRDGTGGDTRYTGTLPNEREVALYCTATDWPNPTCSAELPIGNKGHRYGIIFPPKLSGKLTRMVRIGDELFSEAARRCEPPRRPTQTGGN